MSGGANSPACLKRPVLPRSDAAVTPAPAHHPAGTPGSRSAAARARAKASRDHPPRSGSCGSPRTPCTDAPEPTPRRDAPRSRSAPSPRGTPRSDPPAPRRDASTTNTADSGSDAWTRSSEQARNARRPDNETTYRRVICETLVIRGKTRCGPTARATAGAACLVKRGEKPNPAQTTPAACGGTTAHAATERAAERVRDPSAGMKMEETPPRVNEQPRTDISPHRRIPIPTPPPAPQSVRSDSILRDQFDVVSFRRPVPTTSTACIGRCPSRAGCQAMTVIGSPRRRYIARGMRATFSLHETSPRFKPFLPIAHCKRPHAGCDDPLT